MEPREIHRLAAETGASLATIRKWLADPASVTRTNAYALAAGAKRLRLTAAVELARQATTASRSAG